MKRTLLQASLLILTLVSGASAFSELEKTQLNNTAEQFREATLAKDAVSIAALSPAAYFREVANKAGKSTPSFRGAWQHLLDDKMNNSGAYGFEINFAGTRFHEPANGNGHALVPFVKFFENSVGRKYRQESHLLAISEEGEWRLASLTDTPMIAAMRRIYPQLRGYRSPRGRIAETTE